MCVYTYRCLAYISWQIHVRVGVRVRVMVMVMVRARLVLGILTCPGKCYSCNVDGNSPRGWMLLTYHLVWNFCKDRGGKRGERRGER